MSRPASWAVASSTRSPNTTSRIPPRAAKLTSRSPIRASTVARSTPARVAISRRSSGRSATNRSASSVTCQAERLGRAVSSVMRTTRGIRRSGRRSGCRPPRNVPRAWFPGIEMSTHDDELIRQVAAANIRDNIRSLDGRPPSWLGMERSALTRSPAASNRAIRSPSSRDKMTSADGRFCSTGPGIRMAIQDVVLTGRHEGYGFHLGLYCTIDNWRRIRVFGEEISPCL